MSRLGHIAFMKIAIHNSDVVPTLTRALFPTLLHVRENFLPDPMLASLAAAAIDKADVEDDALKRAVIDFALGALRTENVNLERYDAIELSEMWFNAYDAGEHHWDHTHANHILSGVLYLNDGCFTIFGDPRPAASVLTLHYKEGKSGHVRSYVHKGARNMIVLFPSWLPHRVATTASPRKTIAFNLMLRGAFGGDRSREQITL